MWPFMGSVDRLLPDRAWSSPDAGTCAEKPTLWVLSMLTCLAWFVSVRKELGSNLHELGR